MEGSEGNVRVPHMLSAHLLHPTPPVSGASPHFSVSVSLEHGTCLVPQKFTQSSEREGTCLRLHSGPRWPRTLPSCRSTLLIGPVPTLGDGQVDFEEFVTLLGPKLSTSGIPERFLGTDFDTVFWKVRHGLLGPRAVSTVESRPGASE